MSATYPDLQGRPVLITGGASGIGAAMVAAFAAQGARVGFIDRDAAAAARLLESVPEAAFAACDLRDIEALQLAVAELAERTGRPLVLVNNAARDDRHDWAGVTTEYWDERMATNLRHMFFAIQAVAPGMIAAGGGSVINMGSTSWRQGTERVPAYATAKAAVEGLSRSMARELGPHRIRVNTLVPGWVMTERQRDLWLTPEGEAAQLARQCLPDLIEPRAIADMALFLASEASAQVTAQALIVDAGGV